MDNKILDLVRKANSTGIYIKHKNNIDLIFKATYGDESHAEDITNPIIKLNGWWINMSTSRPELVCADSIKIKSPDIDNWFDVGDPSNA